MSTSVKGGYQMTVGDWLVLILTVQMGLITVAYGFQGFWLKAMYWSGVTILNVAWLLMLGGENANPS